MAYCYDVISISYIMLLYYYYRFAYYRLASPVDFDDDYDLIIDFDLL